MTWLSVIGRTAEGLLFPALRQIAPEKRHQALRRATAEQFDLLEWAGILFGVVVTVSMTRYGADGLGMVDRLARALANLLVAIPVLAILTGPFVVRRTRRGLRAFLRESATLGS